MPLKNPMTRNRITLSTAVLFLLPIAAATAADGDKVGDRTVAEWRTALQASAETARTDAVNALLKCGAGARPLVPELTKALADASVDVRIGAASCLSKIGPDSKDAVPALIKQLSDANGLARCCAAEALGNIGAAAKDALPGLEKLLTEKAIDYRKTARAAIRKINEALAEKK